MRKSEDFRGYGLYRKALTMQFYTAVFLNCLIWLWPLMHGPLPAFWPDFVAVVASILLLAVIPNKSNEFLKTISVGWLTAALLSALIGIAQYMGLGDTFSPFVVNAIPGTAIGNTRQTNHLATFIGVGLVSLFWLRGRYNLNRAVPFAAALLVTALATTSSRTGALQLVFLMALLFFWSKDTRRRALLTIGFVLAIYFAASALLPWILKAFAGSKGLDVIQRFSDTSLQCSSRRVLWSNVLDLVAVKPWWGWGWGELNYAHYETLLEGLRYCEKLGHAHNIFLEVAVDSGLPIAIGVLVLFAYLLAQLRPWRESNPDRQWLWAIFGLLFIHSMLEYPLWFGNFQSLLVLAVLAFVKTGNSGTLVSGLTLSHRAKTHQRIATLLIFLGFAGYVGWDYFKVSQLYTPTAQRPEMFRSDTFAKVGGSFIFGSQVIFAQVVTTDLTRDNAASMLDAATLSLHLSAEPRVIEKVIESAVMLGQDDIAKWHMLRYQRAYPEDYKRWQIVKPVDAMR